MQEIPGGFLTRTCPSPSRTELERLRKENAVLRMERDFAKKVAAWFPKEQP